ncbi:xylose isomerase [Salmonella enterica subsp. enterica serovar Sanjuan]|uniref:Xylose isomerase n=1 Tax=Salmonella enterica subsp. enterica serovar Sanjuan TaxID=1160765 RepID=A0A3S4FZ09_SALET|nr:xylose isomerase [Salmonella enterica subsp. enterica serovar Sanjuan]
MTLCRYLPSYLIMELTMQAYFDQLDRVRYEGPPID